jgi:hypothetical protein
VDKELDPGCVGPKTSEVKFQTKPDSKEARFAPPGIAVSDRARARRVALLLYEATGDVDYLTKVKAHYASVRRYFLDPGGSNLYSVYVFDDGATCTQKTGRYYASVNGNLLRGLSIVAVPETSDAVETQAAPRG